MESLAICAWYLWLASLLVSSRLLSFLFFSMSPRPSPSSQLEDRFTSAPACSGRQLPSEPVLNLLSWNAKSQILVTANGYFLPEKAIQLVYRYCYLKSTIQHQAGIEELSATVIPSKIVHSCSLCLSEKKFNFFLPSGNRCEGVGDG